MALNIFANEHIYGGWQKKGDNIKLSEAMPKEMFDSLDNMAEVTESELGYGLSMCFFMNGGKNKVYKKLSSTSSLKVGDRMDKNDLYVTTLKSPGQEDIYRITEEA